MGIWIDTPTWHDPATLKARGVDGVMRYGCEPWNTGPGSSMPNKRLERAELDQKLQAGIDVGFNWEDAADDALGGYNRGLDKGKKAGDWMLNTLGFPPGASCCSSIDFDVGAWIGSAPQAYQFGFRDGLTAEGPYVPGIYGDTQALDGANADGTAHVFWWSTAKGWSAGVRPKTVHLDQNGYWQWDDSADLNTVVISPFGSYLHPLGVDDMSAADVAAINKHTDETIRAVLGISPGGRFTTPQGLANNDTVLSRLLGLAQGGVNADNALAASVAKLPTTVWMTAQLASIGVTLTDEQIAKLAAAIGGQTLPNYTGTFSPVPPAA